jgi:hypothetical protein
MVSIAEEGVAAQAGQAPLWFGRRSYGRTLPKACLSHGEETMTEIQERRLLQREQVAALLQLCDEDIEWLVRTRQLVEIRVRSQQRFDSKDVFQLIDSYKSTSARRCQ